MKPDITKPAGMLQMQGDRVLVFSAAGVHKHTMTIIRSISDEKQELRLVNRDAKPHKPDWAFTQAWCDALQPAQANKENAKWEVFLTT